MHREIFLGMLGAIRDLFNSITASGKGKPVASARKPAKLSSALPRSGIRKMSQPVNPNEQGNISLPVMEQVRKDELGELLNYVDGMKKNFLKKIPTEICQTALKMVSGISDEIAKEIGVSPKILTELSEKFKQDINPMALRKFQDSLTKIVNFYKQSFNMEAALA